MKVFMGTDMEGCAGLTSLQMHALPDGRYHDNAKKIATAEVNAAVEGCFEAGAEEVLVNDGHGPGAIWFEDLHPRARLLHGRPSAPRSIRDPIIATYDVSVMIGQHAMAGVQTSNQNHTQSSRTIDFYRLNGTEIGEIAQFALYQGALGLPLIFLSGEDAACAEAEALVPGISTVSVKTGLGRSSAISVSAPEAHRRIREGIVGAIEKHRQSPVPPLVWDPPYVLEKRFHFTDDADAASSQPGAERVDGQTVRFTDTDIRRIVYR